MNTKPTVDIMRAAADRMRDYAARLDSDAARLEETGDWDYASEGMNTVLNMIGNLRLDLFIARPLRELEREIHRCKEEKAQQ